MSKILRFRGPRKVLQNVALGSTGTASCFIPALGFVSGFVVFKGTGGGVVAFASPASQPSPNGTAVYSINSGDENISVSAAGVGITGAQGGVMFFKTTDGKPYQFPWLKLNFINDATAKSAVYADVYTIGEDVDAPHDTVLVIPQA